MLQSEMKRANENPSETTPMRSLRTSKRLISHLDTPECGSSKGLPVASEETDQNEITETINSEPASESKENSAENDTSADQKVTRKKIMKGRLEGINKKIRSLKPKNRKNVPVNQPSSSDQNSEVENTNENNNIFSDTSSNKTEEFNGVFDGISYKIIRRTPSGFDLGLVLDEILFAVDFPGSLHLIVKWKESNCLEILPSSALKTHEPLMLIEFYEKHLSLDYH